MIFDTLRNVVSSATEYSTSDNMHRRNMEMVGNMKATEQKFLNMHPLTKTSGLVNHVKYLGLVHGFVTRLTTIQSILYHIYLQKTQYVSRYRQNFTAVRVIMN